MLRQRQAADTRRDAWRERRIDLRRCAQRDAMRAAATPPPDFRHAADADFALRRRRQRCYAMSASSRQRTICATRTALRASAPRRQTSFFIIFFDAAYLIISSYILRLPLSASYARLIIFALMLMRAIFAAFAAMPCHAQRRH